MTKRKGRAKFQDDEFVNEYAKPGPRVDQDASAIAAAISEIKKRGTTGFLETRKAKLLSLYFFEDGLIVDLFNRDQPAGAEMDALQDDLTGEQKQEIGRKVSECAARGLRYLHLGPDDELDKVQLAAKLEMTSFKKGDRRARKGGGDGFTEEELV